jgi:hypothetical protein
VYGVAATTSVPLNWTWIDDPDWLPAMRSARRLTGERPDSRTRRPGSSPKGDQLVHMQINNRRALQAGLSLRPLAHEPRPPGRGPSTPAQDDTSPTAPCARTRSRPPSPVHAWTALESRSPSRAGIAPGCTSMVATASGSNAAKIPPRWQGLNSGAPSSVIRFWSGPPAAPKGCSQVRWPSQFLAPSAQRLPRNNRAHLQWRGARYLPLR